MFKALLFASCSLLASLSFAQISFDLMYEDEMFGASISAADLNHDSLIDFFVNSQPEGGKFINNGSFSFTYSIVTLVDTTYRLSGFEDFDNDGNQDLFLSGHIKSKILYSDSNGNFTHESVPLPGRSYPKMAQGDLNNDARTDFIVTGTNGPIPGPSYALLFYSDGDSVALQSHTMSGLIRSAVDIGDLNNDGWQDVLISGAFGFSSQNHLYLNDGNGGFIEDFSHGIPGVQEGALIFWDIDSDSDLDVVISGVIEFGNSNTVICVNDGTGVFTPNYNTGIALFKKIKMADLDNDGDDDLFIIGENVSGNVFHLYLNDGQGNFSKVENTGISGLIYGDMLITDLDNDGLKDLVISGSTPSDIYSFRTRIYKNISVLPDPPPVIDTSVTVIEPDIYPNPYSSSLTIECPYEGLKEIYFYDLNGRIVKYVNWDSETTQLTLNADELASGMYSVLLRYNNNLYWEKVVHH